MITTAMHIPAIRDEIFLMVLRQVTDNPHSDSTVLKDLWGIMFVCLLAFRPSDLLYPYLIAAMLNVSIDEHVLDKDKRWPQFCLRLAVNNEINAREMSLMKADLDKRVRGAIVVPKVCPISGETWYITQREIDLYASKGRPVPDKAPRFRGQDEQVVKKTLSDAKSGKKPLPKYMQGTSTIPAARTTKAPAKTTVSRTGSSGSRPVARTGSAGRTVR